MTKPRKIVREVLTENSKSVNIPDAGTLRSVLNSKTLGRRLYSRHINKWIKNPRTLKVKEFEKHFIIQDKIKFKQII